MLKGLIEKWKQYAAIRAWQNSTLGKMLAAHTEEYFTKYLTPFNYSPETKNKLVGDFYNAVFSLSKAENPFLAMRERLADYVIGFAEYQVLCLTEEKKQGTFYSDCPYISGALHRHIDKAVKHVDDLRKLKWEHPDISNEELVSFCSSVCAVRLYYMNGFNLVRSEFDDFDKEKDWLNSFIKSMLIWEEDRMREKIGLASLLPNSLDATKHIIFMHLVVTGHRNPYSEWEKTWSDESA